MARTANSPHCLLLGLFAGKGGRNGRRQQTRYCFFGIQLTGFSALTRHLCLRELKSRWTERTADIEPRTYRVTSLNTIAGYDRQEQ